MRTFEITIQRAAGDGWPVVAEYGRGDAFLSQRAEGRLQLDLAAGDAFVALSLQSKLTKGNGVTGGSHAANFSFAHLAMLGSVWH